MRYQLEQVSYDAEVTPEDWFVYQVSGPTAIKLPRKLDPNADLLDTKYMRVTPVTVAGHRIHALRQGMSGEVGSSFRDRRPSATRSTTRCWTRARNSASGA